MINVEFTNDSCLMPSEQYFFARTSYIYDVCFVLDQHAQLDVYSVSSLKQQSAGRHVAPLGHIILISSQHVFAPTLWKLHA